jgi:hypothetical protein
MFWLLWGAYEGEDEAYKTKTHQEVLFWKSE